MMGAYSGFDLLTEKFWNRYPHLRDFEPAFLWIDNLCVRGCADTTILGYAYDLEMFVAHCASIGINPISERISNIDSYFKSFLADGKLARTTVRRRASALKSWFDFLISDNQLTRNPFLLRVDPREEVEGHGRGRRRRRGRLYVKAKSQPPWIPTEIEFQLFADYVRNPVACTPRDRFMHLLSYECALRASELVDVDVEHLDFNQMHLLVFGKGGKIHNVPFSRTVADAWSEYAVYRSQFVTGGGALFVSESNRNYGYRISAGTWNDRIAEIRKAVNLPRFHPHTLRHLSLTDLARGGMEVLELMAFARHENIETTMIYIHLSGRDLARAFKKASVNLHKWRAARFARKEDLTDV
jgi:integrase/recombinase XerD